MLKIRLHQNRLGELLIMNGLLSQADLKKALALSLQVGKPLGQVLCDARLVRKTALRRTLAEQFFFRALLIVLTAVLSLGGGVGPRMAFAGQVKDVPSRIALTNVAVIRPPPSYPSLFGSGEKQSSSLSAFTKWTSMFTRFDQQLNTLSGQREMAQLVQDLRTLQGRSLLTMVSGVNTIVNQVSYINDKDLYGGSDYWATPIDFFARGGDCEDFAIAKYTALRVLGVPEERMRIAIVQDTQKNIPHAVLIVYSDQGPLVLDNQIRQVMPASRISHYRPIFSINRMAWWLHTKPSRNVTVVASSSR